jgi:hypothetical protein
MTFIKSVKGKKLNKEQTAILIEGISANYVMHFSWCQD